MLDFCELFLDLGDVAAVGVQELRLVLLDHVLHLLVHLVNRLVQLPVCLQHCLGLLLACYKGGPWILHANLDY